MPSPHRLLICDDEEMIRESLGGLLQDHGYEATTASCGSEGLKIMADQDFDLVILDIIMPDMDGIEVLARIKEKHKETEVIMITGYADKDRAVATFRLHAYDFIEKPFESKAILNTIKHCLSQLDLKKDLENKTNKLKESEEKYRRVFDDSKDMIFITTREGRLIDVNQAGVELLGYGSKRELLEIDSVDLLYANPGDMKQFQEKIEKDGFVKDYAVEYKKKDGTEISVLITSTAKKDKNGEVLGYEAIIRDVTYQKQLESKLLQAQKMESIGTLAGGIAHDFNNLLMGIQGYVSLILLKTGPMNPHYEMLRKIEGQVASGAHLTSQLLGFARGGKYESKPTNLNELIDRTSQMFGRTKKEVVINTKLEKDPWIVDADQGQIEQVLLNLYVNALHAMPGGGYLYLETSNVTLDDAFVKPYSVEPGKYAKMSVTDTGVGMDEKTQQRIFDPFFTTKEMGRGTGLGLASVYGIVRNHKGIISVYSKKGYGATFNIYFPVSEKDMTRPARPADEEVLKGTETILLVDDEERILDAVAAMLEHLGYTVLLAQGGEAALAMYQANKDTIDAVILDVIMPGMGGGEIYDLIKEIDPGAKVILSSGYSFSCESSEIVDRGANGFIQKPFNVMELSHKIRKVMDNR